MSRSAFGRQDEEVEKDSLDVLLLRSSLDSTQRINKVREVAGSRSPEEKSERRGFSHAATTRFLERHEGETKDLPSHGKHSCPVRRCDKSIVVVVGSERRRTSVRADQNQGTRSTKWQGFVEVLEKDVGSCSDFPNDLPVIVLD